MAEILFRVLVPKLLTKTWFEISSAVHRTFSDNLGRHIAIHVLRKKVKKRIGGHIFKAAMLIYVTLTLNTYLFSLIIYWPLVTKSAISHVFVSKFAYYDIILYQDLIWSQRRLNVELENRNGIIDFANCSVFGAFRICLNILNRHNLRHSLCPTDKGIYNWETKPIFMFVCKTIYFCIVFPQII